MDAAMSLGVRYEPRHVAALPELWRGDVVVVGGGSAGCAAAVAASRAGARTLLLESGGFLGGTGARVLDTFYGFYAPAGQSRVVGGIGWEVCTALFDRRLAFERPNTYGAGTGVTYEPEALKLVWEELVTGSGAVLLLHALATAVVMDGAGLVGLVAETRSGPRLVSAHVVVDASGDAEIAWRAGAAMDRSLPARKRQPGTATFRVGGVSSSPARKDELHATMRKASASRAYDLPRLEGSIHPTCRPGVWHANMTRVAGYDVTDPWELTAAEIEGRRQVQEYVRFLVDQVDGYQDAYLLSTSTRLGIRESRRLSGRYVLTRDDVIAAREFADAIARCGAPVEDHAAGDQTRWEYVGSGTQQPTGKTYGIPFRCLLPQTVEGLIVAGRCLSATHDAHASVRSMAQCMAMGQAAGTAAALAAAADATPPDIDVDELRTRLFDAGAVL
jgi:FAD dependent oxidoreductase